MLARVVVSCALVRFAHDSLPCPVEGLEQLRAMGKRAARTASALAKRDKENGRDEPGHFISSSKEISS
jgi:hypothetical protein